MGHALPDQPQRFITPNLFETRVRTGDGGARGMPRKGLHVEGGRPVQSQQKAADRMPPRGADQEPEHEPE